MRLWSLHPRHLDRQGLIALWREGLLAQAVLAGRTRGYTRHPQLERFRGAADPLGAVTAYLDVVLAESRARGYRFDPGRIDDVARDRTPIPVTTGQVQREWEHLLAKLESRSPEVYAVAADLVPAVHPLFRVVDGPVESWERAGPPGMSSREPVEGEGDR